MKCVLPKTTNGIARVKKKSGVSKSVLELTG